MSKNLEVELKSILVPPEVMKQNTVGICSLPNIDGSYRVEYNRILMVPIFHKDILEKH